MADSLRDQLLKSGLVQKLKSEAKPAAPAPRPQGSAPNKAVPNKHGGKPPQHHHNKPPQHHKPQQPQQHKPKPAGGEPDLAQAYAMRAREEREAREREQREAELRAKEKRERKDGRYLLVTAQIARDVEALSAEALVLLVDPNAPAEDDVPADLIW